MVRFVGCRSLISLSFCLPVLSVTFWVRFVSFRFVPNAFTCAELICLLFLRSARVPNECHLLMDGLLFDSFFTLLSAGARVGKPRPAGTFSLPVSGRRPPDVTVQRRRPRHPVRALSHVTPFLELTYPWLNVCVIFLPYLDSFSSWFVSTRAAVRCVVYLCEKVGPPQQSRPEDFA